MQWRDGLLVLVSLVLGPAIGSLIAGLGMAAVYDGSVLAFSLSAWWGLLSLAYFVGWIPMLAAGIGNALLARPFAMTGRLLLALPVGAVAVGVMVAAIASNTGAGYSLADLLIFSLGGAFASHISVALVELFGPKLEKPS